MHILIVSRGIPTADNPLDGIFEWDQARALNKQGVNVTFIVLDLRSLRRKRSFKTKCYTRESINVVQGAFPLGAIPPALFYHIGRMKLRGLLGKAIHKYGRPDIIHGHFIDIGAIAIAESKRLNIPSVITEHSSALNHDKLIKNTIYFGHRAYSSADCIVSVSEPLKKRIMQHFDTASVVIPNVVDTETIRFHPHTRPVHAKPLFVATGSLLSRKNHSFLVATFASLPPDTGELVIIGEGPERANIEAQIKNLDLKNRVRLLGLKNRKEISDIYSKADCFVLATQRETFGVVYIEAMLAGLPVIATRCGGPEDFITPETGLLIDVDNQEQLYDSLIYMSENLSAYSSKKIHDYAIASFGPDAVAKKLIETYSTLL